MESIGEERFERVVEARCGQPRISIRLGIGI